MTSHLPLRFFQEHPLVIIDPCAEADIELFTHEPAFELRHPCISNGIGALPRLIDVRGLTEDRVDALTELVDAQLASGQATSIMVALSSSRSPDEVASHLGRQTVRTTGAARSFLIRYWDPWVLMHLRWIWTLKEVRLLLGMTSRWVSFVRGESFTLDDSDGAGTAEGTCSRNEAIHDIGILNTALRTMNWTLADIPRLGPTLWSHVCAGRLKHGLQFDDDLAEFARQSHRWGPAFVDHRDIAHALEYTLDGETRFTDALAQIPADRWAVVEHELNAIRTPSTELAR